MSPSTPASTRPMLLALETGDVYIAPCSGEYVLREEDSFEDVLFHLTMECCGDVDLLVNLLEHLRPEVEAEWERRGRE